MARLNDTKINGNLNVTGYVDGNLKIGGGKAIFCREDGNRPYLYHGLGSLSVTTVPSADYMFVVRIKPKNNDFDNSCKRFKFFIDNYGGSTSITTAYLTYYLFRGDPSYGHKSCLF